MNLKNAVTRVVMAAMTLAAMPATAQTFPDKPVKVITPYPAGTGADAVMRQVAEKLKRAWGQPVIVDPRPGANGWIAIEAVKSAAPDGYTLLLVDTMPMAVQTHLYKRLAFDPVKDFEPASPMYWAYFFYVVSENSKWSSMTDLIAAAKAKPGELNYGSWGVGSQAHLAAATVELAGGVRMTHVPFKDTMQIYTSIAGGDVGWALGSAATVGALQRAHKVKFLALAAPKRHPSYPGVPTVTEAGGSADMEMKTWMALFAPRGTPKSVLERINADVAKAMVEPDVRDYLYSVGFEPWSAPANELARKMSDDTQRYGEVVKRLNVSLD